MPTGSSSLRRDGAGAASGLSGPDPRVSGEVELAPGLHALPLPGPTLRQKGVMIADGSERLLIGGDIVHSRFLPMPHPDWSVTWDTDPAEAIATRRRILRRKDDEAACLRPMCRTT